MLTKYYESYWEKRLKSKSDEPIPSGIPDFFKKFTSYGAILNQIDQCENLLDIGCGDGKVAELYKQKAKNVFGIDISAQALEVAEKRGIKVAIQDLNDMPLKFPDDFFDYVILTDVVEHVINPIGLLKEVKRILKKDGRAIITVPNFARLSNRLRMIFIGDPVDILHWSKYGDEVEHLHWFTLPKLKNLLLKEVRFFNLKPVPTGLKNLSFIFGLLGRYNLGSYLTIEIKK